MKFHLLVCFTIQILLFLGGCEKSKVDSAAERPPRPVEVATIAMQAPADHQIISASATSWKSEDIGFEVSGRVEWVAEPDQIKEGRIVDKDGKEIIKGDPIARVESKTYQLQVEIATAELERARQSVEATKTELEQGYPARIRAAEADLELAKLDRDRRKRLVDRNAGAQADADRAEANFQNAQSQIDQLKSGEKAKQAELTSLKFQVNIAEQALEEANRNLKNCVLYSSFRGEVADVFVVPGSFVAAGSPVASIKMMNPIKVEFEVSAEDSRRLRNRQNVTVMVKDEFGESMNVDGYLYLIDPTADLQTRTFTVTVLVKNKNLAVDENKPQSATPQVERIWPMKLEFLPGAAENINFLADDAIYQDADGQFVWKIDNMVMGDDLPEDRILEVSKVRVKKGELQIPFLSNWLFRQVTYEAPDTVDLDKGLIAGKLLLPENEASQWNGIKLRVEAKQNWLIRPGDVVQVDLSSKKREEGLYIPINAVVHKGGKTFLMTLENESAGVATVKKHAIKLLTKSDDKTSSPIREIQATEELIGKRYVTQGAHFLIEGQRVSVIKKSIDQSNATSSESAQ